MTPESAGRLLRACEVEPRVGAYDPRPPEDRELLRQMRRLQSDQRNKLGDGAIAAAQDLEDAYPPVVAERLEQFRLDLRQRTAHQLFVSRMFH